MISFFICLFVHLFVCLFVYSFIYLLIHLFIYLFILMQAGGQLLEGYHRRGSSALRAYRLLATSPVSISCNMRWVQIAPKQVKNWRGKHQSIVQKLGLGLSLAMIQTNQL